MARVNLRLVDVHQPGRVGLHPLRGLTRPRWGHGSPEPPLFLRAAGPKSQGVRGLGPRENLRRSATGPGGSRPGATAGVQAASDRSVSSDWAAADFPPAGRWCTVAPAAGVSAGAVRGA